MEVQVQVQDAVSAKPRVKATFCLASETYSINGTEGGALSEQLASLKEESMAILKDFITKHNVPDDVPDEPVDGSDDDDTLENPQLKSKKTKIT